MGQFKGPKQTRQITHISGVDTVKQRDDLKIHKDKRDNRPRKKRV